MKSISLILLFAATLSFGANIQISGQVRSAADSSGLNGRLTVTIGADSTILPVTDGAYSGSVTGIHTDNPTLPESYALNLYPTVVNQNTLFARLCAPRTLKTEDIQVTVFNLLGQQMNESSPLAFQPLILQIEVNGQSLSSRFFARGPFKVSLRTESAAVHSLAKVASDSVDAIFEVSVDGYETLVDTLRLAVDGPNENDFYLDPVFQSYVLKGSVDDEEGNPVVGALVVAKVGEGVDSIYTNADGFWESDTFKTVASSEEASVEVFKDRYRDWASSLFDVVPGVTIVDATLESNFRKVFLKYQDAGTKDLIVGDSLVVTDAETGEKYYEGLTSDVSFDIPKSDPSLSLEFKSPDESYLSLIDTIMTAQLDTLIAEGIKNFPVNHDYWNGFKDYAWYISRAKFDTPDQRRFLRFVVDSIPVYVPEKVSQGVDWRQTYIDSVINPLNDLVRTKEHPGDYLYVTEDSALAEDHGIRVIYSNNNETVTHRDPNNMWILSNAEVYWKIRPDYYLNTIQTGQHETYLHAIIDGVHSPDNGDNFHGPPGVGPQPHEEYLLQIVRNKIRQDMKGYKDVTE